MNTVPLLLLTGITSIVCSRYVILKDFRSHVFDPKSVAINYKVINSTFLNYNLTILKIHNVRVLCTFRIKRQVKGKMKSMLHWKHLDFCQFLEGYTNDRILSIIFSKLFQSSYIISCPLKEGSYYIKNAYFDADLFGLILQRGTYYAQLDASLMKDGIVRLLNLQMKLLLK